MSYQQIQIMKDLRHEQRSEFELRLKFSHLLIVIRIECILDNRTIALSG